MSAATFSRWCRLCAGAALCQPTAAFGIISSSTLICSRRSHLENWTLLLCPRIFQPLFGVWVLPVGYNVLDVSGDSACSPLGSTMDTFSIGGFGRIFHIFHVAVNSNPEAFCFHSRRLESVHNRCLWL